MMVGQSISHYKLVSQLGEGGMGVVYKAEDTTLERTVALTFLSRETLAKDCVKARLIYEVQAAASLGGELLSSCRGIQRVVYASI